MDKDYIDNADYEGRISIAYADGNVLIAFENKLPNKSDTNKHHVMSYENWDKLVKYIELERGKNNE